MWVKIKIIFYNITDFPPLKKIGHKRRVKVKDI